MATVLWVGDQALGRTVFGLSPAVRLDRQWARLIKPASHPDRVLVIRADVVIDTPSLAWLLAQDALIATDAAGRPLIGWVPQAQAGEVARAMQAGWIEPNLAPIARPAAQIRYFSANLKKNEAFLVQSVLETPSDSIERQLYFASYKGVTDIVTKFAWPWPALLATRACVRLGATPNMVTSASILLSILAIPLFLEGLFLAGLLCAWAMTFLDTVDGKLARVTVSYTRFGNYFDHVADLIFPPIWWWAFMAGLIASGASAGLSSSSLWLCFWVIMGTYALGRLCEGWFELRHKFVPFLWRPFDAWFRLILARRNPNLVILTAFVLLGAPAWGYVVLTLWCVVSAIVQLVALVQSEQARRAGPLQPFLVQDSPA